MNTVGIIGGIGPESTVEYYRKIISTYLKNGSSGNYPQIIINSINMKKMLDQIAAGKLLEVAEYLAAEANKLSSAGADFGLLASNTPHIVFDQVQQLTALPLISIVETCCEEIVDSGVKRVGLFGTKFTMQGGFYNHLLSSHGIDVFTPNDEDMNYIHDKYMSELVKGIVVDETKSGLLNIIDKMNNQDDIQGLILGGTELPLILKKEDITGVNIFDTTEIHVKSVLKRLQ